MPTQTGLFTHHDLPGICTHGQVPVPGLHPYDTDPLTARQLRSSVADRPDTTFCMHFHSTRQVITGDEITNWLDSTATPDSDPVYANSLHPVDDDTPQRAQDLWLVTVNPNTGEVTADYSGDDHAIWNPLHEVDAHPDGPATITAAARELTDQVIANRATERDLSNRRALADARREIETTAADMLRSTDRDFAHGATSESLDRAYNRARMAQAHVDIHRDDLHHLRSYNHFYQLGFPPPTHPPGHGRLHHPPARPPPARPRPPAPPPTPPPDRLPATGLPPRRRHRRRPLTQPPLPAHRQHYPLSPHTADPTPLRADRPHRPLCTQITDPTSSARGPPAPPSLHASHRPYLLCTRTARTTLSARKSPTPPPLHADRPQARNPSGLLSSQCPAPTAHPAGAHQRRTDPMTTANTTAPDKPRRRPVYFTNIPGDTFDRTMTLAGTRDLALMINGILDRYLAILHRSTPKFSDTELCAIFEALGEHWDPTPANIANLPREVADAFATDLLDTKWNIDATHFRNRLDRTGFHERAALAELSTCYWHLATDDEAPQTTIATLKALFRPDPSQQPTSARPRRIPVHHFPDVPRPSPTNDTDSPADADSPADTDPTPPAPLTDNLDLDHQSPATDPPTPAPAPTASTAPTATTAPSHRPQPSPRTSARHELLPPDRPGVPHRRSTPADTLRSPYRRDTRSHRQLRNPNTQRRHRHHRSHPRHLGHPRPSPHSPTAHQPADQPALAPSSGKPACHPPQITSFHPPRRDPTYPSFPPLPAHRKQPKIRPKSCPQRGHPPYRYYLASITLTTTPLQARLKKPRILASPHRYKAQLWTPGTDHCFFSVTPQIRQPALRPWHSPLQHPNTRRPGPKPPQNPRFGPKHGK